MSRKMLRHVLTKIIHENQMIFVMKNLRNWIPVIQMKRILIKWHLIFCVNLIWTGDSALAQVLAQFFECHLALTNVALPAGVSRMQRWKRAELLGQNPPIEVKNILEKELENPTLNDK